MHKGQQTKTAIVDVALSLATQMGLEGLTIGAVAEMAGMSKSGVFAHFGSREELQISVIREYHHRFEQEVFYPVLLLARGLPRLRALFANWMQRTSAEIDSGCLYISGAAEFDDRPGPVRDALASSVQTWMTALHRAVRLSVEQGDLAKQTDFSKAKRHWAWPSAALSTYCSAMAPAHPPCRVAHRPPRMRTRAAQVPTPLKFPP
jgi:AcrR family transcriptional regulator